MIKRSSIGEELKQVRPFHSKRQEALLALLRTAATVKRPGARALGDTGISLAQFNVLRILRGAMPAGLPTLGIRERMVEEAAGITRLIDKLEESGLVRRDRSSPDRRQVFCHITDAGLALLARLDEPMATADDQAMAGLDDAQLDQLLELLELVRAGA
jgi:MarR family transcriptional regulator, organic hydroperoxide resistance regulator